MAFTFVKEVGKKTQMQVKKKQLNAEKEGNKWQQCIFNRKHRHRDANSSNRDDWSLNNIKNWYKLKGM